MEAGHFVGFDLQTLDQHVLTAHDWPDVSMAGQRLTAGDEKTEKLFESYAHRTANAPQRATFQQ
jgi:hypothetical protein